MTVELITGYAGTPHIGSDDIGAFNAGLVGPGDYALATGNQLKATMSNANTIAVQSGDAILNGRHVHLTGTTTATVQSGTSGQKRNDLAVLRYTRNTTTNIEACTLVIIKGTSTTGTPADPAHNTGSILDGVTTHDMLLYRIPINGITVGTLVPLFNVLKPMKDVWDSLTQSSVLFTGPYAMRVRLMRIGRIVTAVGQPSPSSSYVTGELKAVEIIPEGYRPATNGTILFVSNNGGAVSSWYIDSDGRITVRGRADKGYYQTCTGSWLTA